jgi:hypothetical protein
MKKYFQLILLCCSSAVLFSCSSQQLDDYGTTQPALDLKRFFNGNLRAYGMLQNQSGEMTRRFTASIDASWQGDIGLLEETFNFDDGEVQYRTWHLTDHGDGRYSGTAGDVVGEATGSIVGSVFQWQYQLEVPYRDGTITVALDDWLYLIDDDHLINKTDLRKFGFKVGELTLLIEKI